MKKSKEPDEEEKKLHEAEKQRWKQSIRDLCSKVKDNKGNFNDYARAYFKQTYGVDIEKYLDEMISIVLWLVSHDYFKADHKKPDFPASTPTISYLWSMLSKGIIGSMMLDIGICIQPEVQNSQQTEQAVRRIHDRFNMAIYGHVTPEDAAKDRQKHRDREEAKKKKRLHAQYEKARREKTKVVKTWDPEKYLKMKEKERAEAKKKREAAAKESLRRFQEEEKRLKISGDKT